jgi:VanZ family protein
MPSSTRQRSTSSTASWPSLSSRPPAALARWLPVLAWAVVISVFSTQWFSGERTGRILLPLLAALFPHASRAELLAIHHAIRKVAHVVEYLVLGLLLFRALHIPGRPVRRAAAIALGLAAAYSGVDELHQVFVPGRGPAVADCLIDTGGAAAAQVIAVLRCALRAGFSPRAGP